MSMLSGFTKQLRHAAEMYDGSMAARLMREAADTIDVLRDQNFRVGKENEKLRDLVRDLWRDMPKNEACGWDGSSNRCADNEDCNGECWYRHRMRELGIEVEIWA